MDEDGSKELTGCLALLVVFVIGFFIGGYCIQYTLEYWIGYHKAEVVDVSFLMCGIIGVFLGWNLGIVAALVTWVVSLFITNPATAALLLPFLC